MKRCNHRRTKEFNYSVEWCAECGAVREIEYTTMIHKYVLGKWIKPTTKEQTK